MKILGIGNALVDILVPMENEELLGKFNLPKGSMQLSSIDVVNGILAEIDPAKIFFNSGGSAANTIHGLAKLGAKTGYLGKVGSDNHGDFFKTDLTENKIQPHLSLGKNETGKAMALISPDSERTFATFLGSAIELTKDDLLEDVFSQYNILHIEGYLVQNKELIENALAIAKKLGLKVSIDLASYNIVEENREFLESMIKDYVDYVFANEEEAKALTEQEPEEALETISKNCEIAVVKIGEKGSLIKRGDEKVKVDIIKVKAVDTTGAGDLYAAGFLFGLITEASLSDCGKYGSILAGNVIEQVGAKIPAEKWKKIFEDIN
jgi:sugar/nucleoside kinase (ribokinase family)